MKQENFISLEESSFRFDELFFSKTDTKGIILSGNSVFQRVSEYSWEELIHQPHNFIRHPDMPRAVFFILWKFLKEGKPIGAFVKNKSKTGKFYWVFALAMPIAGGFLSVRMKPGGALLQLVEGEYKKIREWERANSTKPEDSAGILLSKLSEIGYPNYSEFMAAALVDQMLNRAKERNLPLSEDLRAMMEIKRVGTSVLETSNNILRAFDSSKYVPINLEIFSNKRGESGHQISVVASQYQKNSQEIAGEIHRFKSMAGNVAQKISESQFFVGAAVLLAEVLEYLKKESSVKENKDLADIAELARQYLQGAIASTNSIVAIIKEFVSICERLNTLGLGLELVRITGKMELARMESATEALMMLDSLRGFQVSLKKGLAEILELNRSIDSRAHDLGVSLGEQVAAK